MTICFSQLPLETQRDIAETLVYCFPTMNERQRVYQIANIYIPFHSIADPVEVWMYVFQTIQKSPKKNLALLEASHFILKSRNEEAMASIQSSFNESEPDVGLDEYNANIEFKKEIFDQTSEALSLLEEICIILEAQGIMGNTSKDNFISRKGLSSHFSNKFTKNILPSKTSRQTQPKHRPSGQIVFGLAALMLLSVGLSFSLSSSADQSSINTKQASIKSQKMQLTNINVETRIKKPSPGSRISQNNIKDTFNGNGKNSDLISISSQKLGQNQYKSKTGIILENVKKETAFSEENRNGDMPTEERNQVASETNDKLNVQQEISSKDTDISLGFVPSTEKDSHVFKDPLAEAISKATDRLIEQHQRTKNPEKIPADNNLVSPKAKKVQNSTVNQDHKKISTVVPLLNGSNAGATTNTENTTTTNNVNNKLTTQTKSKTWVKCTNNPKGTLYGYWWAGKISSEEEKFTSGQIVYIGNWSNVRKAPSSKTDKVCVLQPGQQIKLKEDAKVYGNSQWVAIYSDSIQ